MLKQCLLTAAAAGITTLASAEIVLNGAGASFPAPVYQNWTYRYSQATPGVTVNYQSIGSGAGVNQIKAGTVTFAGSDNPLSQEEQRKAGLHQFPMLTGGVVVIVNLPGVADNAMKLDGATLGDIYLGKITRWDAPEIRALNPDLKLPALKITVVRRADASGTSFIFTDYLSKVSPAWRDQVGAGSAVKWPLGIGGQKNPGVCNNVAKIRGAVGYTEYTYAYEAKLTMVQLRNRAGKFVSADTKSFSAGAANADWANAPGLCMNLTDQPGDASWPIVGVTYCLFRDDIKPEEKKALFQYFNWCYTAGREAAEKLNYVPLPDNVIELVRKTVLK